MSAAKEERVGGMNVTDKVREKYGEAARRVLAGEGTPADCCGSTGCCSGVAAPSCDPITAHLYVNGETADLPSAAVLASLGCGNPTALAELAAGEIVLDLGSGGGIDVLLSARRVGPTGKAYGLDMTDEMLELARRNATQAGVGNVEFLKGQIEAIPLPDASVDVIISNCVINLSGDKRQVFAEAFRVLKPGGRFAVSDVVVRGDLPPAIRRSLELWVGCVAGALEEQEFVHLLGETGFEQVTIEPTRIYRSDDARGFLEVAGLGVDGSLEAIDGRIMASFIRATKPVPSAIKVRAATAADLPHVERLLRDNGLPTDGIAGLIATHPADFLVGEVAAADGSPHTVAVAGLEVRGHFALLRSTAVDPAWRAQGVGARLTRGLIALAESRSLEALYLLTTTAEDYFPRFGFTRVSRDEVPEAIAATSEFRTACPQSAAVMRRVLPAASQRSAHASP